MSVNELFKMHEATWKDLLSNGKIYHVPRYQRDYSWSEEDWEDLWSDIKDIRDENGLHYMGYIVFRTLENGHREIIDGQQRFATLSILALAVIKHLMELAEKNHDAEANTQRSGLLRQTFLNYKDPASLHPSSKLFLNRNNNDFYLSHLLLLREPPSINKLSPSQKRLWDAFRFFHRKIKDDFGSPPGPALADFLSNTVGDRLRFTAIEVLDELNAYKIFETLNARGVKLSSTDLLKNHIFSMVAKGGESDLEEAERRWQVINETLETKDLPTFARTYWNSCHDLARKNELFRRIKTATAGPVEAFELLDRMERQAPRYVALGNPADSLWEDFHRSHVSALNIMEVTHWHPLALSAWERLEGDEMKLLLRMCEVIAFRYNAIGSRNPKYMESAYSKAAVAVSQGRARGWREVYSILKSDTEVMDDAFKNDFTLKSLNSRAGRWNKLIKYILFSLEEKLAGQTLNREDPDVIVEPILPEGASQAWAETFPVEIQSSYLYRIGNFTLLEREFDQGDRTYDAKASDYRKSRFQLTRKHSVYSEWTPEVLHKRQQELANLAVQVWRLDA